MPGAKVGVFRNSISFLEDSNGNEQFDQGSDRFHAGDTPVAGDWTGDGCAKVGIYRTSTGTWYDGVYDAGDYTYQFGSLPGDVPVSGDWSGLGKSCVGIYRSPGSEWLLDLNCNGMFENTV
jgi:hypothetical protein